MVFHRSCACLAQLVLIGILLGIAGERAIANAPAPMRPPPDLNPAPKSATLLGGPAAFVVRRDAAQEQSRIIIPRRFLPASSAPARLDGHSQDNPRQKTTTAGLLLSTVISGGGLAAVLARRRKMKAAVVVLAAMLLSTVALGAAMAKSPPPRPAGPPAPTLETKIAGPQVAIEVVETGSAITLVLGKDAPQFAR